MRLQLTTFTDLPKLVTKPFVWFAVCMIMTVSSAGFADELILDESLSDTQTVGDFDVSTYSAPVELDESGLLDENGVISAGKLYSFFKNQGIESMYQLNFAFDLPASDKRSDYQLNSINLEIENLTSASESKLFTLGDQNSLIMPSYEASNLKPEAQIGIQLGYDFMKQFNENSTEKIKLNYTVDDETAALPVRIGVLSKGEVYSPSRMFFLLAFAGFWAVVFMVLFRVTTPKAQNHAYTA